MNDDVRIVTVDATNVDVEGFFCYKSKPKAVGYRAKLDWLQARFDEGLRIKQVAEGKRTVGFVEYVPGEYTWRAVAAPDYLVIHCLWVVGRAKEQGYGGLLLNEVVQDAQRLGKRGVAMVTSTQPWLAGDELLLKHGFQRVDSAPPSFSLLVKPISGPLPITDTIQPQQDNPSPDSLCTPHFPTNWAARLASYGPGVTVVYADQCPYMPDAVAEVVRAFGEHGVPIRTVRLQDAATVRAQAPSAYGVFGVVWDGVLFTYHYLGPKEWKALKARCA